MLFYLTYALFHLCLTLLVLLFKEFFQLDTAFVVPHQLLIFVVVFGTHLCEFLQLLLVFVAHGLWLLLQILELLLNDLYFGLMTDFLFGDLIHLPPLMLVLILVLLHLLFRPLCQKLVLILQHLYLILHLLHQRVFFGWLLLCLQLTWKGTGPALVGLLSV